MGWSIFRQVGMSNLSLFLRNVIIIWLIMGTSRKKWTNVLEMSGPISGPRADTMGGKNADV
jgi:hypothetical protein